MHIYKFSLNNSLSEDILSESWIKACYRNFRNTIIEELFLIRQQNGLDIFTVGSNPKAIFNILTEYFNRKLNRSFRLSEDPLINSDSLIYFFESVIGKRGEIPFEPRLLLQIREDFNLALDEGMAGSILTKMYRQGESIGNQLQVNSIIKKNCVAQSEVILDISQKIAGDLQDFQFIFIGIHPSDMKEIINILSNMQLQKKYIYHDDFAKAYQIGIELGCVPLDRNQLENQLEENTIIVEFEHTRTYKLGWLVASAKKNRNFLYIYFDLSGKKQDNQVSYPQNLYIQTMRQVSGLIATHINNRREYLQTLNPLLENEVKSFYSWLYSDERFIFNNIVSADRRMQKVFELLRRIAPSDISVLISGETGTGKELIARAIHDNSKRSEARFIAVNCSAIPDTLLEGELFGYEKGAFTGAVSAKKGLIEIASGGTLFLDEIGDLPPMIQVKLLRVLQEREILPIGSTRPVKVNIRLVTATNQHLEKLTENGQFRSDLYYRVNTVQIKLPSLQERKDDIPILTDFFIKRLNRNTGKQINKISDDVLKRFMLYDWPGNIRELENVIERAFAVSIGEEITVTDLPTRLQSFAAMQPKNEDRSLHSIKSLRQNEVEQIRDLIINKNLSLTESAHILGIGRTTLWRKMRKFGISKDQIDEGIE
jgi:transcriptional regulator with PAS, ATPase and Fis domain